MELTKRQQYGLLKAQLDQDRSTFMTHWHNLADHIAPRRPRFTVTDVNKGDRRNRKIIDATATLALRTLRSGMMGGITSPARPWFRLTTSDPNLSEVASVKLWLHVVSQRMESIFQRSNLYNVLPTVYGDLGTFGTSAMLIEEDFEKVLRFFSLPIGSYRLACSSQGKVDIFQREFQMTARQIVQKFGMDPATGKIDWSNISERVKNLSETDKGETWINVAHVIRPNSEYDSKQPHSKYKKFESCYYELSCDEDKYLRESGYDYFPVLAPRWETTGEDTYGTDCPGMVALGDIRALQLMQKRKAEAVEKMVRPPMVGPTSMMNQKASILPGDITYADMRQGEQGFRPAYQVTPQLQELLADIQDTRQTIKRAFFEDLFLMLSESDRREITATEIDERKQEKLLALGPVLEQLNQDLLDPLIDISFDIGMKQGQFPPAPPELQGMPLKVEYISIMAQAQKAIAISSIERLSSFVANASAVFPEAKNKIDIYALVDEYGDSVGVNPRIIRSDDQVQAIEQQQQQAMAQQQRMEAIQAASQSAKNLSQTDVSGKNALTSLMQQAQAGNPVGA